MLTSRTITAAILSLLLLPTAFAGDFIYTMRPHDNVWLISQQMLKNPSLFERLAAYNNIENPLAMLPGQHLKIPSHWLKIEPAAASVVSISGKVLLERPDEAARELHLDDKIQANDTLITQADSSALLGFADHSQLHITSNSRVNFDRLTAYGNQGMVDTSMRLLQGSVESKVSKRQSPSLKFDIQTPISLASVRGTDYRVAYTAAEQTSHTEVITGRVLVSNPRGGVQLPAGMGHVAHKDQAPGEAIPLLQPISLADMPSVLEYLPPSIKLNPAPHAVAYEVQVSNDAAFKNILAHKTFEQPIWRINDLADGTYWLRIRAIDAHGLRGLDAAHTFTVAARPEPPLLMMPKANGIVRGSEAKLRWSESSHAKHYLLRLNQEGSSAPLIMDAQVDGTEYVVSALAEGEYQWQIASVDAQGKQGPFSERQTFQVRPAVTAEPPSVDGDTLELRWHAVDGNVNYAWQLARDKDFSDLVEQGESRDPSLLLPRPEGGEYYLRIAIVDDPKEPLTYGATQKFDVPTNWNWLIPLGGMIALIALI